MISYPLSYGLGPGMTVTRASDGWVREANDANGERWASVGGNNIARISSPDGGLSKMLLVEPARTNRALRSAELATAPWVDGTGTPVTTANARNAPDGTATADDIQDDNAVSSAAESREQGSLGFSAADVISMSVFQRMIAGVAGRLAQYNGAVYALGSAATATWSRATTTATASTTDNRINLLGGGGAAFPTADTDTGTTSFWNAQAELGAWPSSPIPTAGSTVTRSADACAITTAQLEAHMQPSYGRIKLVWRPLFSNTEEAGAVWLWGLSADTGLRYQGSDDRLELFAGGARVASLGPLTFAQGAHHIITATWNGTAASDSCHLEVIQAGTSLGGTKGTWTVPTLGASISIGSDVAGANQAGGHYGEMQIGYG